MITLTDAQFDDLFTPLTDVEVLKIKKEHEYAINKKLANMNGLTIDEFKKAKPCKKCNGSGKLNQYNHIAAGKCFKCNGLGLI